MAGKCFSEGLVYLFFFTSTSPAPGFRVLQKTLTRLSAPGVFVFSRPLFYDPKLPNDLSINSYFDFWKLYFDLQIFY